MSDDIVIRVENLSKRYVIKHASGRASGDGLRHAIQDAAAKPFRAIKRSFRRQPDLNLNSSTSTSEDFWALRDVSFEVRRGEVLGIIGRNGAGKSTLLKILSRITEPSSGRIGIKGRVASLLEVGTGFHPELTGRENVFLNGAILGMAQSEVKRQFDEIVDFSGVEKFIDTPVKRYSSGMYVRLAFAVAAHLEPEILIIDEVLAVGDSGFQKKCLGKMQDVAGQGRTVLFVSHDLAAVEKLCPRAIYLKRGRCAMDDATAVSLAEYQTTEVDMTASDLKDRIDRRGEGSVRFSRIQLLGSNGAEQSAFRSAERLTIRLHYKSTGNESLNNCRVCVSINAFSRVYILASTEFHSDQILNLPAFGFLDCVFDDLPLSMGTYLLSPFFEVNGVVQDSLESAATLSVEDGNFYGAAKDYPPGFAGKSVLVRHRWIPSS